MFGPLWLPLGFPLVSSEKWGSLGSFSFGRRHVLGGAYTLVRPHACSDRRVLTSRGGRGGSDGFMAERGDGSAWDGQIFYITFSENEHACR